MSIGWQSRQWSGRGFPKSGSNALSAIAVATGRKEAEVVREALGQYLGKNDLGSIKGDFASKEDRVTSLERKFVGLLKLVG